MCSRNKKSSHQETPMGNLPAGVLLCVAALAGSVTGDAFVSIDRATVTRGPARGRAAATFRATSLAGSSGSASIVPEDFLQEANAWRAEVGAPPLKWDAQIAEVSQQWADTLKAEKGCDMEHSTAEWQAKHFGEPLGENVAWACCDDPPRQDGKAVVDMWASEKKSFAYGPVGEECTSHDGGVTGHYTQLVWAESKKMGCGMATCGDAGTVWVCNFFPAGNFMGEVPFCRANIPADMPTCPAIGGLGEGMPCEKPAQKSCGYEEKCCSCTDAPAIADMGAEEVEEGKEDEAAGERDEEAARDHHDEAEMEEGEDEVQAGAIEEQRGEAKEAEYLSDHEFKKVIEVAGLDEKDFDEVKFQEAVAETLGIELFEVSVGALDQGRRRRLLAAQGVIAVPVTVKCDGPAACSRLRGQLEGNICNGGLGRVLSEAFGVRISTPGCQQHLVPASPHEPQYISFPDAYPNSVRHWLLIGMLSMCLGAGIVFIFTFVPAKTPPMANVLVFMILSVAMCAYYCMWAGVFVDFKTTDETPRVIFYPKYLDWIVTCPLTLAVICLVADADSELLVSMAGNAILMVLCGLVGSTIVAPYKYIWWVLGVVFLLIILMILGRVMRLPRNGRAVRRLVLLTAGVWVVYPIVWITGSEGTAALGLTQEVALTCGLDLVAKVAFAVVSAIACRLTQDEVLAQMPTNCASSY